jgi:hypothetical protein
MPEILTADQIGYLNAAISKLEALRDGTLQPGNGERVSTEQKIAHLRLAAECIDVVIQNLRREQEGLPATEVASHHIVPNPTTIS